MKADRLVQENVKYMPPAKDKKDGVLYVSHKFQLAIHMCACGCRIETVTPLDDGSRGWVLTESPDGPSLHPSIGNMQFPCGSHYWVRAGGRIEWC